VAENSPTNKIYRKRLRGKRIEYIFKFDKIYVGVHKTPEKAERRIRYNPEFPFFNLDHIYDHKIY
jgi:hypothetical protein